LTHTFIIEYDCLASPNEPFESTRGQESRNMTDILTFFQRDSFAKHNGIELLEASVGTAKAQMNIGPEHLNGLGTVHGGAIFTLADFAFAAACNSHGTVAVAINADISYTKAAREGTLTAEAREVSLSAKLGHYLVHVTDDSGDLVAIFRGMAYRKRERLEDKVAGTP
jgi:acyl-CoA thioesterase